MLTGLMTDISVTGGRYSWVCGIGTCSMTTLFLLRYHRHNRVATTTNAPRPAPTRMAVLLASEDLPEAELVLVGLLPEVPLDVGSVP